MCSCVMCCQVLGQQVADTIIALPNDAPPRDQLMVMKLAFSALMSADSALVEEQLVALGERLGGRQEPWTVCMYCINHSVHVCVLAEHSVANAHNL